VRHSVIIVARYNCNAKNDGALSHSDSFILGRPSPESALLVERRGPAESVNGCAAWLSWGHVFACFHFVL
jgi:hypothetical protein